MTDDSKHRKPFARICRARAIGKSDTEESTDYAAEVLKFLHLEFPIALAELKKKREGLDLETIVKRLGSDYEFLKSLLWQLRKSSRSRWKFNELTYLHQYRLLYDYYTIMRSVSISHAYQIVVEMAQVLTRLAALAGEAAARLHTAQSGASALLADEESVDALPSIAELWDQSRVSASLLTLQGAVACAEHQTLGEDREVPR